MPHRRGGGLVRQVEALRLLAARRRDLRPLPAADPGPGPQPPPGARDLRAVPLAGQVRGRPLQGQHAFSEDEANTETKTVLPGAGRRAPAGRSRGSTGTWTRAHVSLPRGREARRRSPRSRWRRTDGTKRCRRARRELAGGGQATEWRQMDCVDCHNRPSHIYRVPEHEIDTALLDRRIDRDAAVRPPRGAAALRPSTRPTRRRAGHREGDRASTRRPTRGASAKTDEIAAAGGARRHLVLERLPEDEIAWGTYPNHIGHAIDMSGAGLLPLPRRGAQERRRGRRSRRTAHLPLAPRPGGEGPGDPQDDPQQLSLRGSSRSRIIDRGIAPENTEDSWQRPGERLTAAAPARSSTPSATQADNSRTSRPTSGLTAPTSRRPRRPRRKTKAARRRRKKTAKKR